MITISKMYTQGNREKYWFAYRTNPLSEIQGCEEKYVIYGCKDESTVVVLSVLQIEKRIDNINLSQDEDGNITHWNIVFFKDVTGHMTCMLSKPEINEIPINKYVL